MSLTSKIGIPGVTEPTKKCEDPNCPFHGSLKVRGRIFTGTVVKNRMTNAITVQIDYNKNLLYLTVFIDVKKILKSNNRTALIVSPEF